MRVLSLVGAAISLLWAGALGAQPLPASVEAEAPQPRLRPSPWRVMGAATGYWRLDPNYTAFDDIAGGLTGGVAVQRDLTDSFGTWALAVEAGYQFGRVRGSVREVWATQMSQHMFELSAVLRWQPLRWLTPYARLGGGAGYFSGAVSPYDNASDLEFGDWHPAAQGGLGAMLWSPRLAGNARWRALQLVFSVEGGFLWTPSWSIALAPPAAAGGSETRVSTQGTAMGEVSATAPYLRFGFGVAF